MLLVFDLVGRECLKNYVVSEYSISATYLLYLVYSFWETCVLIQQVAIYCFSSPSRIVST